MGGNPVYQAGLRLPATRLRYNPSTARLCEETSTIPHVRNSRACCRACWHFPAAPRTTDLASFGRCRGGRGSTAGVLVRRAKSDAIAPARDVAAWTADSD